jgi:hypothetical protein
VDRHLDVKRNNLPLRVSCGAPAKIVIFNTELAHYRFLPLRQLPLVLDYNLNALWLSVQGSSSVLTKYSH